MKLLTYQPEITTSKQFPGLISCNFKHEIKTATAELSYLGPRIDPEVWCQVLRFFQWTYDTTHSESQVRLFVNMKERRWAAWAFPQKAKTGMSAEELDTEETKKQRAQFSDADGWVYFGTVHHHCSMSAFQSGTDKNNEEKIDGLHITIGSLGSPRYDLHARFYLGGFCFEPDLARFWDVGENISRIIPIDLWDKVARFQMTTKPDPIPGFPDQWKENLIEVKQPTFPGSVVSTGPPSYGSYGSGGHNYQGGADKWRSHANSIPAWQRARRAVGMFAVDVLGAEIQNENAQRQVANFIGELAEDITGQNHTKLLLDAIEKYDVSVGEMWEEVPADLDLTPLIASYQAECRQMTKEQEEEEAARQLGWHGHMMD